MFLKILILVCLSVTVLGQFKPGDCPPLANVGICEINCFADNHCPGTAKCCQTACGGTFCVNPVTMRTNQKRDKPGYCPDTPTGPWVCSSRCAYDSDCRGIRKCCKNRCGAMACTKPEF